MGGSAGIIGRAVQAGNGFGGKGSGMGRSDYAQGFTPVGQAPARTDTPVQQPQQPAQQPQFIPGSAFGGGFGQPMFGGFGGGFGGKSSGLGQFGMMNSPFGGFNPYAQQSMMQQPMMQQPMGGGLADAMQQIANARMNRPQQPDIPVGQMQNFNYANIRPDMLIDPSQAGWSQFSPFSGSPFAPIGGMFGQQLGRMARQAGMQNSNNFYTDPQGNVWTRAMNQGGVAKEDDEE